ncbi:hypothetical protein ACVWZD_008987 [Streptomyces sp. TE3672]
MLDRAELETTARLAAPGAPRQRSARRVARMLLAAQPDMPADEIDHEAVPAARAAGQGANRLAELVAPAISRPVALKLVKRYPDYLGVGHQVSVPEDSVSETGGAQGRSSPSTNRPPSSSPPAATARSSRSMGPALPLFVSGVSLLIHHPNTM